VANDYNPNSVARNEMRLLYLSIKSDGYTQPIVTIWDQGRGKYVVVDGFHRLFVCKTYKDIAEHTGNRVPIVVIEKPINDRMASTVRHNRARGKHSVDGMANMVFQMLDNGWDDAEICNEMGLEAEELVRLKHITGFSKLFEDVEYRKSWESVSQLRIRRDYEAEAKKRLQRGANGDDERCAGQDAKRGGGEDAANRGDQTVLEESAGQPQGGGEGQEEH
jgi:ParB-like chromosome segregation protein Spo0J